MRECTHHCTPFGPKIVNRNNSANTTQCTQGLLKLQLERCWLQQAFLFLQRSSSSLSWVCRVKSGHEPMAVGLTQVTGTIWWSD
jgi:hypothetical protein